MSPEQIWMMAHVEGDVGRNHEFDSHKRLIDHRRHGEWFSCGVDVAFEAVLFATECVKNRKVADLRAAPVSLMAQSFWAEWPAYPSRRKPQKPETEAAPIKLTSEMRERIGMRLAVKLKELAAIMGVSEDQIEAHVKAGGLVPKMLGSKQKRYWFFVTTEVERYFGSQA